MARTPSTAGGRPVVVSTRFSTREAEDMDARRGSLSRAEWLRYLAIHARKHDLKMPSLPPMPSRPVVEKSPPKPPGPDVGW